MPIMIDAAGKDVVVHRATLLLESSQRAGARVWKQLETNWPACFLLHERA